LTGSPPGAIRRPLGLHGRPTRSAGGRTGRWLRDLAGAADLPGVEQIINCFPLPIAPLLFEDRDRNDPQPQRAAENSYQFIDRVDDPVFARVRATFNEWVGRFASLQSDKATNDLVGRFRSKPDGQFYSAFWELYLHEVHTRLGFTVRVHPESDRGTRPDFSLSRDGRTSYLEAVMPSPPSDEPRQPGSVRTVMEYIDSARNPDFFLNVRFIAPDGDTRRKRDVVGAVEDWLSSLDWDTWWRGGLSPDIAYPEVELAVRGWLLGLRALPRSPDRRGGDVSWMIGMYPATTGFPDSVANVIAPTLDEKANKYGDLDGPYVVAVWTMSAVASEDTPAQALFGVALPLASTRLHGWLERVPASAYGPGYLPGKAIRRAIRGHRSPSTERSRRSSRARSRIRFQHSGGCPGWPRGRRTRACAGGRWAAPDERLLTGCRSARAPPAGSLRHSRRDRLGRRRVRA
jgi:hypothetical protein